jgi:hypothetical protein
MDFKEFLLALTNEWIILMSGVASVILAIVGTTRKWEKVPPLVFWGTAVACFFFASIRIWTIEYRARLAAEKHLQDLTVPEFSGSILYRSVAPTKNETDSIVTLTATIKNTGAPSIADDMAVKIRLKNGKQILLEGMGIPTTDVKLSSDTPGHPGVILLKEEFLPLKTIGQPIVTGGAARGWMWGVAKGVKTAELMELGATYIISFTDVSGKAHEISSTMIGNLDLIDPTLLQKKPL